MSKLRPVEFQIEIDRMRRGTTKRGLFHQWGERRYVNADDNPISETFGIVEADDGEVHEVEPYNIKFLDTNTLIVDG